MKRVILTTGGTGGHIFPALAVAEELRRRDPAVELLFLGGRYGQEADLAAKAGLDFVGLPVRGFLGRGLGAVTAAFGMARGLLIARRLISAFRPDMVLGFGGYAAFAGVLAARLAGVPTAVHEQNAYPGMSNRLLGRVVDRIFLSLPDASGRFDAKKTRLAGNPVRSAIADLYEERMRAADLPGEAARQDPARPPRLLVMGGSLGARAINRSMPLAIGPLRDAGIEVWHQTGAAEYDSVRAAYRERGAEHLRVEAFISDMRRAYAWADLVLCRAGASSIAEISASGLPAILVPFPGAAKDHQRHNARFLEREGGALILEQNRFYREEGDVSALIDTVIPLIRDRQRLETMAQSSLAAARPYAARDLVDGVYALFAERQS